MTDWQFHHVGVVTSDLAESIRFYTEVIGCTQYLRIDDMFQDATIVLLAKQDSPIIELISPLSSSSPAAGWLKRIQAGPYHTCYVVEDIKASLATLTEQGLKVTFGPVPAVAFDGALVAFVWGRGVGLLELLQGAAPDDSA